MSLEVMISDFEQSPAGAFASTVNSTSPVAGAAYENPDALKMPTLGLLAGTTRVYWAQFAPAGLPVGQFVFVETRTVPVEGTAGLVEVAAMVSSGIVN